MIKFFTTIIGIVGVVNGAYRLYQDLRKREAWTTQRIILAAAAATLLLLRVIDLVRPKKKRGLLRRALPIVATVATFWARRA